jgi:hypothetical protein
MEVPMPDLNLGHASIDPEQPVVAGSYTTVTLTYTAGHPIDDSGYLKIAFRSVSDVGAPQFDDPSAANYVTVETTGDCSVEPRWDPKGHTRPWSRALFLQIRRGFLNRGESITVVFGDTSHGSPGWQMQTFCEERFEFKLSVDPIATYQFKELPMAPAVQVVAGSATRAILIAPSEVPVKTGFSAFLKLEDRWGNPTRRPKRLEYPGWGQPGVQMVTETDKETGLSARSNPIDVLPNAGELTRFWADFHGQTGETVGIGTIEKYYGFARDVGLLDIAAHQGNDFQITDHFWAKINDVAASFYQPGSFVTFPGYEWSGNTPLGGDRNVYFASECGQITRSCRDLLPGQESAYKDSPTAADLFNNLADQGSARPFVFAHVGGRYADLSAHDEAIELAVEVHSAWGTFEWLVDDALRRGLRVGICANSDGHTCRPGASYPGARRFGSLGGLTCVLAGDLSRESIMEALTARRFYATTGNRCLVTAELATADGRTTQMGEVIAIGSAAPHMRVRVVGTAPVESVQIRNGVDVIATVRPYDQRDLGNRLKVVWSGAEVRGRDRQVRWDGELRLIDNAFLEAMPINFWNANQPLIQTSNRRLVWQSTTTGGVAGIILRVENPDRGVLALDNTQLRIECEIGALGLEPKVFGCGGLQKEISIYALPDQPAATEFAFDLILPDLRSGDNPLYVRVSQEDGHMAWTSPIYAVQTEGAGR